MKTEDICHGCGEPYSDCVCEEIDAEMNEGKYPDCDPNDGDYKETFNPDWKCDTNDPDRWKGW